MINLSIVSIEMAFVDTLKIEFSAKEFKLKLLLYISPRDTLAYFIIRVVSLGQVGRKESPFRFHSGITPLDFVHTEDTVSSFRMLGSSF